MLKVYGNTSDACVENKTKSNFFSLNSSTNRFFSLLFLFVLICVLSIPLVLADSITVDKFTTPGASNINIERKADKLNFTWDNEYVTILSYFDYEGDKYTWQQALGYDVTYGLWKIGRKFGGIINLSNAPQIIKDNGYRLVFEIVDKSDGVKLRKEGKNLWLDNNVYIDWRDMQFPSNVFNVWDKTLIYSNIWYDTVIWDPIIEVTNVSVGIFNQTFFNSSSGGVEINKSESLTNGTYITPVQNLSNNGTVKAINNITFACDEPIGTNCSASVRTKTFNWTEDLILYADFDSAENFSSIQDLALNNGGTMDGGLITTNGKFDRGFFNNGDNNNFEITFPFINQYNTFKNMTVCAWVNIRENSGLFSIVALDNSNFIFSSNSQRLSGEFGGTGGGDDCQMFGFETGAFVHPVNEFFLACFRNTFEDECAMFINGTKANREPSNRSYTGTTDILVGAGRFNLNEMNGTIDEVMVWNRSLSDSEINQITNWTSWNKFTPRNFTNPTIFSGDLVNGTYTQVKVFLESNGSDTPVYFNSTIGFSDISGEVPPDIIPPTFTNNQNNASSVTKVNGVVNFSITVADETALKNITFYWNDTGSWIEAANSILSGTSQFYNTTQTVTSTQGNFICGNYSILDTSLNENQTNMSCFTVANTAPTTPTITSPYDTERNNTRKIEFFSTDADSDALTYNIYINNTLNITTSTNITVWNGSDGAYNLTITSTDGIDTSDNSSVIIFIMDTTGPVVNIVYPTNLLNISSNSIDLNATAVDNFNNSGVTYFWVINGTINTTTIDSNTTFNASDGFYNLTLFVSDDLQNGSDTVLFTLDTTAPIISNLVNLSTTNISSLINWTTNENANASLSVGQCPSLVNITHLNDSTIGTNHNFTITGLINSTTYCVNASSTDSSGNIGHNATFNFTTAKTVIIIPLNITAFQFNLTIGWNILPQYNITDLTFSILGTQLGDNITVLSYWNNTNKSYTSNIVGWNVNANQVVPEGESYLAFAELNKTVNISYTFKFNNYILPIGYSLFFEKNTSGTNISNINKSIGINSSVISYWNNTNKRYSTAITRFSVRMNQKVPYLESFWVYIKNETIWRR